MLDEIASDLIESDRELLKRLESTDETEIGKKIQEALREFLERFGGSKRSE